jgi:ribonuclease VapC
VALLAAPSPFTSTLAAWEAIIILSRPDQLNCAYSAAEAVVVEWLEARKILLREPGSARRVLSYAVAVAEPHGIGKRRLSNLDCFHHAYAKVMRAVARAGPAFAPDRPGNLAEGPLSSR